MADEEYTPDADPEVPAAPPPPQYVTKEEFQAAQAAQAQLSQTLAALNENMTMLREGMVRAQPRAEAPTPSARITRAQWLEAVRDGDERVLEAYDAQQKQDLLVEHVNPLRDTGLEAIANLTKRTTSSALPYYTRFQKEIDAFVANLPAAMRMSAEVYQTAHEVVVGRHIDELTAEAKEAALRGAVDTGAESADAGRGGRGPKPKSGVPTPEDLGGREMTDAMRGAGKTADGMAQRMGYASWEDYMTKTAPFAEQV